MKILYVITTTDCGGAEKALLSLACTARRAGHEVKVASVKPSGAVAKELRAQNIEAICFDVKNKFSLTQWAGALARLITEIQNFKPDIVHGFLYRGIQLCRQAKKHINFRLITTPHYDLSKQNYFMRLRDRGLKDLDDISCAESQKTATFLTEKQKYKENKVRLMLNGVDHTLFAPNAQVRADERAKLGFVAENTVFCCVARLAKEKNLSILLQSFKVLYAKNPLVRLVLIGDGPEKSVLEAFLEENRLKQAVLLVGEVSDVRPYLLAADVFVLPSLVESLPLALLEACSCRLPALVSKTGDMPQVVEHGKNGFVFNAKDPVMLATLMAELAENEKLRRQMGEISRTRTIEKYPPNELKYLEIYNKLK